MPLQQEKVSDLTAVDQLSQVCVQPANTLAVTAGVSCPDAFRLLMVGSGGLCRPAGHTQSDSICWKAVSIHDN